MRYLLALLGLVLLSESATAQSFYAIRRERAVILTAGLGTSTYFGELSLPGNVIDAKPAINLGLQYYLSRRISARAELTWFTLEGNDAEASVESGRRKRNLSFQSSNFELSVTGIVNFFPNGNRYYRRPQFNLYGFGGIGALYFNPKATYQGQKYALQPLQTEGVSYSRITPVIPFGFGARVKFGPNVNISIEGGYRITFSDYLDDVSTVHKDISSFSNPVSAALSDRRPEVGQSLAAPGSNRGNPDTKDGYFLVNVKVEYYLPWNLGGNGNGSVYSKKRSSFYRYNKRGGMRKR